MVFRTVMDCPNFAMGRSKWIDRSKRDQTIPFHFLHFLAVLAVLAVLAIKSIHRLV